VFHPEQRLKPPLVKQFALHKTISRDVEKRENIIAKKSAACYYSNERMLINRGDRWPDP
jgi:hypothetical protein